MTILRRFLGWDQPILPAAVRYLLETYATGDNLDLSGVVLVFPGRRASRRILELLVEACQDRWPDVIPPTLTTFDRFPELLYPQRFTLADDLTQLLVWIKALHAVPARERQAAIATLPPDDAVTSWMSLCESLRRQHDELAGDGLEFDHVFEALSRSGLKEEAERWKALRRIQSEYLVQMDDLELWDRQSARLIAVEQQECTTNRDIVLVGTVDMNRIVRQMLDQVADRVTALIHAPESAADLFDSHGCLLPEKWEDRRIEIPDGVVCVAGDPQQQARRIVDQLADQTGNWRADEISIAVADDALVPVLRQELSAAGVSGRWPVGPPLSASRPWRLLDAVATHLTSAADGRRPDFSTLAVLVRHPDAVSCVEQELAARGLDQNPAGRQWLHELDLYLARHLQPAPGTFLGSEPRRSIVSAVCAAVDRLLGHLLPGAVTPASKSRRRNGKRRAAARQQLLPLDEQSSLSGQSVQSSLERRRPLREWTQGVLQLLGAIYGGDRPGEDTEVWERISACIEALSDMNDTLQKMPLSILPRCNAGQALAVLLRHVARTTVAPPVDEGAIDMMGWLELPLDDSPVALVAGFNEGRIPQSVTSDVFLPNSIRSQLGLTDNRRRYARDAWALETLLHNRRHLTLVAGRRNAEGDPLTPSRLWFAGREDSVPERVLQFYRETSSPVITDIVADPEASAERNAGDFVIPEPPLMRTVPDRIAVSHFREFIECPYRYLLRRELGLREVEDQPREMDAPTFGDLLHGVLREFGESDVRHATTVEAVETCVLDHLSRAARRRFGSKRSATVAVQLQMAEQRLRAFAGWQAAQAREGWRIHSAEKKLECSDFSDTRGRTVILHGRVDRIDQHERTEQWRVLDYKCGDSEKNPSRHRVKGVWVDLQLPLYRLLVRSRGIRIDDLGLGYVNLPGDVRKVGNRMASWSEEDLAVAEETAREVASRIIDLRIDRVAPPGNLPNELSRICQDAVVDRRVPWLRDWQGRLAGTSG